MRYGIRHSVFGLATTWFALTALVGCRSVEVVEVNVAYPLATVHVAAKFEADEEAAAKPTTVSPRTSEQRDDAMRVAIQLQKSDSLRK